MDRKPGYIQIQYIMLALIEHFSCVQWTSIFTFMHTLFGSVSCTFTYSLDLFRVFKDEMYCIYFGNFKTRTVLRNIFHKNVLNKSNIDCLIHALN